MHRHSLISVAYAQRGSRFVGSAAAAQLKPRHQELYPSPGRTPLTAFSTPLQPSPEQPNQPRSIPTAKSWAIPAPTLSASQIQSKPLPPREYSNKWTRAAPKVSPAVNTNPAQSHPPPLAVAKSPARSRSTPQKSSALPATAARQTASTSMNAQVPALESTPVTSSSAKCSAKEVKAAPIAPILSSYEDERRQGDHFKTRYPSPNSNDFSKSTAERSRHKTGNLRSLALGEDEGRARGKVVLQKSSVKKVSKPKPKYAAHRRKNVFIPSTLTVATLARLLNVKLGNLLNKMRRVSMESEANYDYILNADYAMLLAEEFGLNPIVDDEAAFDIHPPLPYANSSVFPSRPPVVTIMGHVDHGKTTLLDTLRSASVAKGEAGVGLSQSPFWIHAAFSAMRARGANVTDIVVLVVAADDGIMPQTKEVISLLKKEDSQVELVVALNKIDKPGADLDSVKTALMVEGVQLEELGGDVPAVPVSGFTGQGLPELIETLSAVAEVRDLRAERDGPVHGHVLESNMHKGLGSVSTVLIRRGCLRIGSHIICGTTTGKVRRMTDSNGKVIQAAYPGMAVTVSGWKTMPRAGDEVLEGSESDIKKALANRMRKEESDALQQDAEAINESRRQERDARATDGPSLLYAETTATAGPKELRLIIKADVSGSCEALEGALSGIGNHIAISRVISTGVGEITESDIMMAKATNATIVGFSVSAPRSVQSVAAQNEVPIMMSNIIYRIMDDVRSRVIDMVPKVVETKVIGEATVLQIFDIHLKGKEIMKVAGCRVANGLVEKSKFARIVRAGTVVHEGSLDTLRQLKKDVTEARKGTECGLSLKDFSDIQEGDIVQMYEKIEKPGVL